MERDHTWLQCFFYLLFVALSFHLLVWCMSVFGFCLIHTAETRQFRLVGVVDVNGRYLRSVRVTHLIAFHLNSTSVEFRHKVS